MLPAVRDRPGMSAACTLPLPPPRAIGPPDRPSRCPSAGYESWNRFPAGGRPLPLCTANRGSDHRKRPADMSVVPDWPVNPQGVEDVRPDARKCLSRVQVSPPKRHPLCMYPPVWSSRRSRPRTVIAPPKRPPSPARTTFATRLVRHVPPGRSIVTRYNNSRATIRKGCPMADCGFSGSQDDVAGRVRTAI